jgi:thiol-disulfide isomerase/thioredoxin
MNTLRLGRVVIIMGISIGFAAFVEAGKNGNGKAHDSNNKENGSSHGFICKEITKTSEFPFTPNKPTLVVFFSPTCSACTTIKDPINAFVEEFGSQVNCVAVNVDEKGVAALAQAFRVTHVPVIAVVHKQVGGAPDAILKDYLLNATGLKGRGKSVPAIEPEEAAVEDVEEYEEGFE